MLLRDILPNSGWIMLLVYVTTEICMSDDVTFSPHRVILSLLSVPVLKRSTGSIFYMGTNQLGATVCLTGGVNKDP